MPSRSPLTLRGVSRYSAYLIMRSQVTADALPADPFLQIMDALPPHVQVSPRLVSVRTLLLVTIGLGLLAAAWWFSTQ